MAEVQAEHDAACGNRMYLALQLPPPVSQGRPAEVAHTSDDVMLDGMALSPCIEVGRSG